MEGYLNWSKWCTKHKVWVSKATINTKHKDCKLIEKAAD